MLSEPLFYTNTHFASASQRCFADPATLTAHVGITASRGGLQSTCPYTQKPLDTASGFFATNTQRNTCTR